MAFAFDTLAYANHLKKAGVEPKQAEAHAEAVREFVLTELVTKGDLFATKSELNASIASVQRDLGAAVGTIDHRFETLDQKIETQTLRLTVRLGAMLVAAVGLLAVLDRMLGA